VIATKDVLVSGQWNPFRDANADGDYGRDCPVDRLVIREGEPALPRAAGLYVHTPTAKAKAYYAVVTSLDGVQNTADISDQNSLAAPVDESPAEPEPVFQRELPKMPMFNYPDKRLHYVTWAAPPHVNLPSQYYNWTVAVPEKLSPLTLPSPRGGEGGVRGAPLELSLHRDGDSYWRTQYHVERDSIVLCPHDFPLKTWWYGYHESCGTLRSFKEGAIHPYTERRLLAFVDWAAKKWPVDRNRILVTGCRGGASGSGALHLALRYPEVFNLVVSGHGLVDYADAARTMKGRGEAWMGQSMQAVWGKAEWGLKTDAGKNVWDEHDLATARGGSPLCDADLKRRIRCLPGVLQADAGAGPAHHRRLRMGRRQAHPGLRDRDGAERGAAGRAEEPQHVGIPVRRGALVSRQGQHGPIQPRAALAQRGLGGRT